MITGQNHQLIDLLVQNGVDPSILISKSSSDYLVLLTSSSIDEIKAQPASLQRGHEQLHAEWLRLTCQDYKSFLNARSLLQELELNVDGLQKPLDDIDCIVPKLTSTNLGCQETYEMSLELRGKLELISSQLEYLEPIIEIPTLFDTLLRNNCYEEAMDLQLYTQRLSIRYPGVLLLEKLALMNTNLKAMCGQLYSMLRGPIMLPLCIRIIGYLRRLKIDETTLRVTFLCLRNDYLQNLLNLLKESESHDHVRRWAEIQRDHFLDIITHYKAIFPDSNRQTSESCILGSFCNYSITQLLAVLDHFLEKVMDIALLPPLNSQFMYYGLSLGRVGLDFRSLLALRFQNTVCRIVEEYFNEAQESFELEDCKLCRPGTKSDTAILMTSLPVTMAYNLFMTAFNQLRCMPCISIYQPLSTKLLASLGIIVDKVIAFNATIKRDSEIIAWILRDYFIPIVVDAFNTVLGQNGLDYSALTDSLDTLSECAGDDAAHGSEDLKSSTVLPGILIAEKLGILDEESESVYHDSEQIQLGGLETAEMVAPQVQEVELDEVHSQI